MSDTVANGPQTSIEANTPQKGRMMRIFNSFVTAPPLLTFGAVALTSALAVIAFASFNDGDKPAGSFSVEDIQSAAPSADSNGTSEAADAVSAEETLTTLPTVEEITPYEPTAFEKTTALFEDATSESALAQTTWGAAMSGDMQSMKDTAYFLFNGFEGLPEDKELAAELYTIAANAENTQAQVDYAYIQYHGLVESVIPANKDAALETINDLGRSWVGGEKLLNANTYKTASISYTSSIQPAP